MLGHMTSIGHKLRRTLAGVFLLAVGARVASAQQTDSLDQAAADLRQEDRLLNRWVGAKTNGLPFWLDFFADSMLVISDNVNEFATDFALTPRSLVVHGDSTLIRILATSFNSRREGEDFALRSSFEIQYRFSLDRLLLTADGTTITMSPQTIRARRIEANWIADLPDGMQMELRMDRVGNVRYRVAPGGSWRWGAWERNARDITFDWSPDSPEETELPEATETPDSTLIWSGLYDARGDQIVLEHVGEGTGTTIFRRIIR